MQDKPFGYSNEYAVKIDTEVEKIIRASYEKAKKILSEQRETLEEIAKVLLEKETLEQEEFELIVSHLKPNK